MIDNSIGDKNAAIKAEAKPKVNYSYQVSFFVNDPKSKILLGC